MSARGRRDATHSPEREPSKQPKLEDVRFNPRYLDQDFQAAFREAFANSQDFRDDASGSEVAGSPFASGLLQNVFDAEFVQSVRKAVLDEPCYHKSNDLYEFYQSQDLRLVKSLPLVSLREVIYSPEFVGLLSGLTGCELNDTVDLSAHRYPDKGFLLCHDDDIGNETEGRRIAFILYLVEEDWTKKDGGRLDMFDKDGNNLPRHITHSLIPTFNSLAFFEVGRTSYHQVSEVTGGRERVSVSGWFHGPLRTQRQVVERPFRPLELSSLAHRLEDWINPIYLDQASRSDINDVFVDQSSVRMCEFLRPDVYERLLGSLRETRWGEPVGPASVRRYSCAVVVQSNDREVTGQRRSSLAQKQRGERSDGDNKADVTEETSERRSQSKTRTKPLWMQLQDFFRSHEFADYITSLTELEVTSSYAEVRKFGRADYTLLHDHAKEPDGLDLVFSCTEATEHVGAATGEDGEIWDEAWGGALHYVSKDENLLTVLPGSNSLDLAYRIQPAQRFVKYLNHSARAERREFSLIYAVVGE